MADYEASYIFKPNPQNIVTGNTQSSAKQRKASGSSARAALKELPPFVTLFSGKETLSCAERRFNLFKLRWGFQETLFNELSFTSNLDAISEVVSFIRTSNSSAVTSKLPTGLIVTGPGGASHAGLFEKVVDCVKLEEKIVAVTLNPVQTPNLKSTLKYINQCATNQSIDPIDDDISATQQKGSRQLAYDLQILHNYVHDQSITRVILSFQDSEAFETGLLIALIDVLSSWNDRIPFVLLFGIATTVNMIQDKLTQAAIRSLQGTEIIVAQSETEDLFRAAASPEDTRVLWLGPGLSRVMIQRQDESIQSVSLFVQAVKYAYMTHFFANPLCIFLEEDLQISSLQPEHFEAVRNLASFQMLIERLLGEGNLEISRKLLENDQFLGEMILHELQRGHESIQQLLQASEIISILEAFSASKVSTPWSELYIKAMSGELQDPASVNDSLLSIRHLPSSTMRDLIEKLSLFPIPGIIHILQDLEHLISTIDFGAIPLRSEYGITHETLRTTIVAHKVKLSKQTSSLSKAELEYSQIVRSIDTHLRQFFQSTLINPRELFLNEILVYDLKSPDRDVFASKPRLAVERALSSPHDYLGCDCCEGLKNALSGSQPATAVLYQLYLESGTVINAADLWSAFSAVLGVKKTEDDESDQQRALVLFSQGLAELKYMGMIKNSQKKADHLTKLLWNGL